MNQLAEPRMLWLAAVLVPLVLILELGQWRWGGGFKFSGQRFLPGWAFSWRMAARTAMVLIKCAAVILLVYVLARPQRSVTVEQEKTKGINIMMALDLSGSMMAEDLKPRRVDAAKTALSHFIKGLPQGDRAGLVIFAGRSFTQCPLTLDHELLLSMLDLVKIGETIGVDGTAIGDGLVNAVNVLDAEPGKSKVVVLATDGVANTGVQPLEGARLAAAKGIIVYTIGMGKKGGSTATFTDESGQQRYVIDQRTGRPFIFEEPDEKTLGSIADLTGGKYFRATDERSLEEIYQRISAMTKDEFKQKVYTQWKDDFFTPLLASLILLLLYFLLDHTAGRILPA